MIGGLVSAYPAAAGVALALPNIVPHSLAWHAQRYGAQLMPVAAQLGGGIPMPVMGQMAYGEFSVTGRRAAQFILAQSQLVFSLQGYYQQHCGMGRWGSYGRPCLSAVAFEWMQTASCWHSMPPSYSLVAISFPCVQMSCQPDYNTCARVLNRVLNGSSKHSLSMQDMQILANSSDPTVSEAACAFLRNPAWMQQITGGDGDISREDLNRASISPQNAADARTVATHMRSIGMNVMPSDAIMRGQAANLSLPLEVRAAYDRLMAGGEYSAYRAIEQFDVNKQPDGCSGIWNFDQAASYYGL